MKEKDSQKIPFKITLIAGFAIFLMFFGGGNLVFPLVVSAQSGSNYGWATFGIFLSAVIVPLIGLLGIMRHNGDYKSYFRSLGGKASGFLVFFILLTLAPLGCIPRNILVSFGGFQLLYPSVNLAIFSLIYCLVAAFCLFKWKSLVESLGKICTPVFLVGVFLVIAAGLYVRPEFLDAYAYQHMEVSQSFFSGLTKGYLTMDLLGSFFFAGTAYLYLRDNSNKGQSQNKSALLRAAISASVIAAILLTLLYAGFGALGARFAQELQAQAHANYLPYVITHIFGPKGLIAATAIIIVACFTTMIALVAIFAELLQKTVFPVVNLKSMTYKQCVWITLAFSYVISLLGFGAICDISQMILDVLYPALIAYGIMQLFVDVNKEKPTKLAFWGSLALSLASKIYTL